jgi:hypothetical protein
MVELERCVLSFLFKMMYTIVLKLLCAPKLTPYEEFFKDCDMVTRKMI